MSSHVSRGSSAETLMQLISFCMTAGCRYIKARLWRVCVERLLETEQGVLVSSCHAYRCACTGVSWLAWAGTRHAACWQRAMGVRLVCWLVVQGDKATHLSCIRLNAMLDNLWCAFIPFLMSLFNFWECHVVKMFWKVPFKILWISGMETAPVLIYLVQKNSYWHPLYQLH